MMNQKNGPRTQYDICIIGAGPAGSILAIRLAILGYQVALIEHDAPRRERFVESLSPEILPILEEVGCRQCVEDAAFLKPKASLIFWAGENNINDIHASHSALHIDRRHFDQILRQQAANQGVDILPGYRTVKLKNISQLGERSDPQWQLIFNKKGCITNTVTHFIVDASGRKSSFVLPSAKLKKQRLSPPTIALSANWKNTPLNQYAAYVEANDSYWVWAASITKDCLSATVFVDPQDIKCQCENIKDYYLQQLSKSTLLSSCIQGQLISKVHCCDASCRTVAPLVNSSFIKVGDAAFSLDPLSSHGVQYALISALQASSVINTFIKYPESTSAAIEFYTKSVQSIVQTSQQQCTDIYLRQYDFVATDFWMRYINNNSVKHKNTTPHPQFSSIPTPDTVVRLADNAVIKKMPVLLGNKIILESTLSHPSLERATAFLTGIPVSQLLGPLNIGITIQQLYQNWSLRMNSHAALDLIHQLWDTGIIDRQRTV